MAKGVSIVVIMIMVMVILVRCDKIDGWVGVHGVTIRSIFLYSAHLSPTIISLSHLNSTAQKQNHVTLCHSGLFGLFLFFRLELWSFISHIIDTTPIANAKMFNALIFISTPATQTTLAYNDFTYWYQFDLTERRKIVVKSWFCGCLMWRVLFVAW